MKSVSLRSLILAGALAVLSLPSVTTAQPVAYEVDGGHSTILYRIQHMGASNHYGRFNEFTGKVMWDNTNPAGSAISFSVKAESIDSGIDKRDQHLRSADFFNVKEFPSIDFKSTGIAANADGTFALKGDLTMLGVTKPIEAKLTKTGEGKGRDGKTLVGAEALFSIKRSDFGLTYGGPSLGEDVTLIVAIEAVQM